MNLFLFMLIMKTQIGFNVGFQPIIYACIAVKTHNMVSFNCKYEHVQMSVCVCMYICMYNNKYPCRKIQRHSNQQVFVSNELAIHCKIASMQNW
jgi:hypothetical protein